MLPHPSVWQVAYAVAITIVFIRGTLFDPLRERGPEFWRDLVKCPLCSGVWIGAGYLLATLGVEHLASPTLRDVLGLALEALGVGALTGTVALGVSYLLSALDKLSD